MSEEEEMRRGACVPVLLGILNGLVFIAGMMGWWIPVVGIVLFLSCALCLHKFRPGKAGSYGSSLEYFLFFCAATTAILIGLYGMTFYIGVESQMKLLRNATDGMIEASKECAKGFVTVEPKCTAENEAFVGSQFLLEPFKGFLYLHITGGILALLIGPLQLYTPFRRAHLNVHRWLGRVYTLCIFAGATGGVALAISTVGGIGAAIGFLLLALLWVLSMVLAVRYARNGEIDRHKRMMIRNYFGFTFAAVTLRIELFFLNGFLSAPVAYSIVAWSCWVINIIVVEIYLRYVYSPSAKLHTFTTES